MNKNDYEHLYKIEQGITQVAGKINNHDPVNHPSHYTDGGIETIDFIRAKLSPEEFRGYCLGNALKYLSRAGKKGEFETDIKKAIVYLNWSVEK